MNNHSQGSETAKGAPSGGRILYFVPEREASRDGVLHAQVWGQAGALADRGYACMFVGSDRTAADVEAALALPAVGKFDAARVYAQGDDKPSYWRMRKWTRRTYRACLPEALSWRPDAVYARSPATAAPARRLADACGAMFVFDMRALPSAEIRYRGREGGLLERARRELVARAYDRNAVRTLRAADRVLCVSGPLREWVRTQTGRADAEVVPCCVDVEAFAFDGDARSRLRAELGWAPDVPVLVYSGSIGRWQRVDDVLRVMAAVRSHLPAARLLLVTRAVEQMERAAREAGLPPETFAVRSALHSEVPAWLSVADVAIILRERHLVNEVASPVKVGEYLAVGLPVVCSEGIGDLSGMVVEARAGLSVPEPPARAAAEVAALLREAQAGPDLRRRSRDLAVERLSWRGHLATYDRVYGRRASRRRQ